MKLCIVTVYDSLNSGSYWQAFALGQLLKTIGHDVYYYRRVKKGASSSKTRQLKKTLSFVLHGRIRDAKEFRKKISRFKAYAENFTIIDKSNKDFGSIDYFILGSDTIWNMDSKYFLNCKSVFWGDIFKQNHIISYAGSLANTDIKKLVPQSEYTNSLERWKSISVRDEYTKDVFSKLTDKEIKVVCDPTLLLESNDYKAIHKPISGDYIFVYLFNALTARQNRELRAFANARKLKIICGTYRNVVSGYDDFIINEPGSFMGHMLGAKYVITDTFHGTIFSANLQKNFVAINRNKKKVNGFLERTGLEDRLLSEEQSISELLEKNVDFSHANKIIKSIRDDSIAFLKNSIAN